MRFISILGHRIKSLVDALVSTGNSITVSGGQIEIILDGLPEDYP